MKLKKMKRFILLAACIGCFSSTLIVSAGSNNRCFYNSQKTVSAYSKGTYTKGTKEDKLTVYATVYGGVDAKKITSVNPGYYTYKPGGGSTSVGKNFYWGKSANKTHKLKKKYASAAVFVTIDDTTKVYAVFE
jgi:hypothetical protein